MDRVGQGMGHRRAGCRAVQVHMISTRASVSPPFFFFFFFLVLVGLVPGYTCELAEEGIQLAPVVAVVGKPSVFAGNDMLSSR